MRPLAYLWAGPTTAVGLAFAAATVLSGGRIRQVDGVLELHGGFCTWFLRRAVGLVLPGGAAAMTLGHVVLGRSAKALDDTRAHEHVHVRQCERWGPLFLPAYGLASLLAWARGQDAYRGNRFEREAYGDADAGSGKSPPTDGCASPGPNALHPGTDWSGRRPTPDIQPHD